MSLGVGVGGSRCHPLSPSWHRGGHVQLVDGSDLSYVEDGTPCGPGMLCLDRKCLPATAFNFSSCPGSWDGKICFDHGVRDMGGGHTKGTQGGVMAEWRGDTMPSQVCSNEGKCICRAEWTGKDCSVYDPIPEPKPTGETERYKGPCAPWGGGGTGQDGLPVPLLSLVPTGWDIPLCPQPSPGSPVSPPPPRPGAVAPLGTAGSCPPSRSPQCWGCPGAVSSCRVCPPPLMCVPVPFSLSPLSQVPVAPISLSAPSRGPCWWLPSS